MKNSLSDYSTLLVMWRKQNKFIPNKNFLGDYSTGQLMWKVQVLLTTDKNPLSDYATWQLMWQVQAIQHLPRTKILLVTTQHDSGCDKYCTCNTWPRLQFCCWLLIVTTKVTSTGNTCPRLQFCCWLLSVTTKVTSTNNT
jgi:hypothetical protein